MALSSATVSEPYLRPILVELDRRQVWEAINGLVLRRQSLEADIAKLAGREVVFGPELHRTLLAVTSAERVLRASMDIDVPDDDLRLARHS